MQKKKKRKKTYKLIKIIMYLIVLIIIFNLAPNYEINDTYAKDKINLIINNNNVTKNLKYDLFINDKNVIYMAKEDVGDYFDKSIIYDEDNNQVITTYGEKVVKLPINKSIIKVNDRELDVLSGAIEKDGIYYIPITTMNKIYEMDIEYVKEKQILLMDSLTKKLVKADVAKNCKVKYKATVFSKTVDKLEKANKVIIIENLENNWTKIRTKNGIIGYVKTKTLQNEIYIREDLNLFFNTEI